MGIEIGSLVVRGTFGEKDRTERSEREVQRRLDEMRRQILDEVRDLLEEQARRTR